MTLNFVKAMEGIDDFTYLKGNLILYHDSLFVRLLTHDTVERVVII